MATLHLSYVILKNIKVGGPIMDTSNSTDKFGRFDWIGHCLIQLAIAKFRILLF